MSPISCFFPTTDVFVPRGQMIDFKAIDRAYYHTYSNPSLIGKHGSWLDQSEYSPLLGSARARTRVCVCVCVC